MVTTLKPTDGALAPAAAARAHARKRGMPDLCSALRDGPYLRDGATSARLMSDAADQICALHALVAACCLLSSESEEYEFDDGMGRGAALDYWHEFEEKLAAARAAIEGTGDVSR